MVSKQVGRSECYGATLEISAFDSANLATSSLLSFSGLQDMIDAKLAIRRW